MKKALSVIIALALMLSLIPLGSALATGTGTTGDCTWSLTGTALTISGNGATADYPKDGSPAPWGTDITSVTFTGSVTAIGNQNFLACQKLTSVTLPSTLKTIGESAFSGCSALESITLPNGLTSIKTAAFMACTGLTAITVPEGVKKIEFGTFSNCKKLAEITLPKSLTEIEESAFVLCSALKKVNYNGTPADWQKISVSTQNNGNKAIINAQKIFICDVDGHKDGNKDGYCDVCKENINVTAQGITGDCTWSIVDNVLTIKGSGKTSDDYWIVGKGGSPVISPDNMITDAPWAKYPITKFVVESGVTELGAALCYGISTLETVEIADSVKIISDDAFNYTGWYNNQPNGIVYAGKVLYKYKGTCPETVTVKNGTVGITAEAFSGCTALDTVVIPAEVENIGDGAFKNCSSLKKVFYRSSEENWRKITVGSKDNSYLESAKIYMNYHCDETGHVFDNACDDTCNICGETRTVGPHQFGDDDICDICGYEKVTYKKGDLNGDGKITDADAVYLLMNTFFPDIYPVNQPVDYYKDGKITDADAVYLLMYTFFPEDYPIE